MQPHEAFRDDKFWKVRSQRRPESRKIEMMMYRRDESLGDLSADSDEMVGVDARLRESCGADVMTEMLSWRNRQEAILYRL